MKYLIAVSLFSLSMLYGEDADLLQSPELGIASESLSSVTPGQIEHVQALAPPKLRPQKNITISTCLSYLFPGLGHYYLGDTQTATALMGTAALGYTIYFTSTEKGATDFLGLSIGNLAASYGLYAVYRDTRRYNGESLYSYKMPQDSFYDLAMASFNPRILKKPEVWGGFCAALTLATAVTYVSHVVFPNENSSLSPDPLSDLFSKQTFPLNAFLIGISEESLFRGNTQSRLLERFNPTVGIILSSLSFGAAHIPNAIYLDLKGADELRYYSFSIPFITALGGYLGWMTYKNGSLQEAVALHSWYDFTLFTLTYLINKADKKEGKQEAAMMRIPPKEVSFSFSF